MLLKTVGVLKNGVIIGVNREELEAKEKIILSKIDLSIRELSETLDIPSRSVQRYISNLRKKVLLKESGQIKMVIGKF